MNKKFKEIIEKVNDKDIQGDLGMMLVPARISIPALLNLALRIERIEKALIPKIWESEQE